MMKNLEQIRAHNALKVAGSIKAGPGEGDPNAVCKKVPSLIINNGLLATAAFANEGKAGIQSVIHAIEMHLQHAEIRIMEPDTTLLTWLSSANADAQLLRRVTNEAMAYLNYLRRFVEKKKERSNG